MIEVRSSVNFVEKEMYCRSCDTDNVPTWKVTLSHRSSEYLCESCLYQLMAELNNTLMGLNIKRGK